METVRLTSSCWSCEPVARALGFAEHLRGLKMIGPGQAMLLETSTVHAFGMKYPFRAVGLTEDYVVTRVVIVHPWTAARFHGCRYVLELPLDQEPPPIGEQLEVSNA